MIVHKLSLGLMKGDILLDLQLFLPLHASIFAEVVHVAFLPAICNEKPAVEIYSNYISS